MDRDAVLLSYFSEQGDVAVAKIEPSGSVLEHVVANHAKPFDAHQAISMGIDPAGRVHLALGAHNSTLFGTYSKGDRFEDGFYEVTRIAENQTYPMFLRLKNDLLLLSRSGPHFDGVITVRRQSEKGWVADERPLLSGSSAVWSCGPYLNTPLVSDDDVVSLFFVWRMAAAASSAGAVVNSGIDFALSRDGLRSLETANGIKLHLPVTPHTAERIVPVRLGASLINQSSAALRADGSPAAIAYWSEGSGAPQYRLCWFERGRVKVSDVSRFTTVFGLDGGGTLPLPHSRPELLFDRKNRAVVIYRSVEIGNRLAVAALDPPDYDIARARQWILVDEDLGFYEPIVNRAAWTDKQRLGLYLQRCHQGRDEDGKPCYVGAPARYSEWTWEGIAD